MIKNLNVDLIIKMVKEFDDNDPAINSRCITMFEPLEKKWSGQISPDKKQEFSNDSYKVVNDFFDLGYEEGFKQGVAFIKAVLNS